MLARPDCLHIPPLYEDQTADIAWGESTGAQTYELDYWFDETFASASLGREWMDLHSAGQSWTDAHTNSKTWQDFRELTARGTPWQAVHCKAMTWSAADAEAKDWKALREAPMEFTGFSGAGKVTIGPEQGETWEDIRNTGRTWLGVQAPDHTWGALVRLPSKGLSWESCKARYLGWNDWNGQDKTWSELRDIVADADHRSHPVHIPLYKKKANFRVRARKDTEYSDYLTSDLIDTLPRSLAKYKPPCLHVPALYEEGTADIVWGGLYGAQGFTLERQLGNKAFTVLYDGKGQPVTDQNNKKNCGVLSKIGDVSTHFHFIDTIPRKEKTAAYRVKAYNTTDSSQYLVSASIDIQPRSLAKYKPPCLHIPALHEEGTADIVWGGLYGAQGFTLERKLGNKAFTVLYNGKGQPAANVGSCDVLSKIEDVDTHFHFIDTIPYTEKTAAYRVRAYNTTDSSQYLESGAAAIIPLFYREDSITLSLKAGSRCYVQLFGRELQSISGLAMTLLYDPQALSLVNFAAQTTGTYTKPGAVAGTSLHILSHDGGKLSFQFNRSAASAKMWSGLLSLLEFAALQTKTVTLTLS